MKRVLSTLLSLTLIACLFSSCSSKKDSLKENQIKAICELATVECYYNNVSKSTQHKGSGITHVLEKDRDFWIEYEGFAKIGIDMNSVDMKVNKNEVIVKLPSAKLLDLGIREDTLNSDSFIIEGDSLINKNKITAESQQKAITEAQAKMEKSILSNKALFEQAEKEAKELISNYIDKMGRMSGNKYKISWKKA